MELEVKIYNDPILRKKAKDVKEIDDRIIKILDTMKDIMYQKQGIGLAAEQVGLTEKLVVIDLRPNGKNEPIELINPVILESEGVYEEHEEGCLSVPGYYGSVKDRKQGVKVRYLDRDANEQIIETDDFLSVVLQHELDHLNGVLFIDRMSYARRIMFKKQWKKMHSKRGEV